VPVSLPSRKIRRQQELEPVFAYSGKGHGLAEEIGFSLVGSERAERHFGVAEEEASSSNMSGRPMSGQAKVQVLKSCGQGDFRVQQAHEQDWVRDFGSRL
jgi:hypothetical protein